MDLIATNMENNLFLSSWVYTDATYTPSQLLIVANIFFWYFSVYVELKSMDLIDTNMENELFMSGPHWWLLHAFPILIPVFWII